MQPQISCPSCNHPVDPQERYCTYCGVDLALATSIAEQAITSFPQAAEGIPLAPEILVPRLGDYLIEKGVLTITDLDHALDYQKRKVSSGQAILIGQALLELSFIDRVTLDSVITEQILQLQNALQKVNRELEDRVRRRTADLQQALSRLAELNQLKSNFVSNISHELRTPLTHLKGYLELLTEGTLGDLNPDQKVAIEVMVRSENRLEKLIEDLIQFSLVSQGELTLQLKLIFLQEIVETVLSQAKTKALDKQVNLISDLPRRLPKVKADSERISWVLSQLLDNAIKFTPKGGIVQIRVEQIKQLMIVSVQDNGIGIEHEKVEEIFEPFHQLDSSATRRYEGTGLGLALVRRILKAHGSKITVNSMVGRGSRFEFHLPVETS